MLSVLSFENIFFLGSGIRNDDKECLTSTNEIGICKPLHACAFVMKFSRRKLIQQYVDRNTCLRPARGSVFVCCPDDEPGDPTPTTATPRTSTTTTARPTTSTSTTMRPRTGCSFLI